MSVYRILSIIFICRLSSTMAAATRCPELCECNMNITSNFEGIKSIGLIDCEGKNLTDTKLKAIEFPDGYEILKLKKNRLTEFPQLSGSTSFRDIDLSGNNITRLPTAIPSVVKIINLDLNSISGKLSSTNFSDAFSNIRQIYLGSNKITEVAPGTFEKLSKLKILTLRGNNLTALNGFGIKSQLFNWLNLDDNPIDCEKTEAGFCAHMQNKPLDLDGACAAPAKMGGKPFRTALSMFCSLCYKDGQPWCKNNGACLLNSNKTYVDCNCTVGFKGQQCQHSLQTTLTPTVSSATSKILDTVALLLTSCAFLVTLFMV